MIRFEKISEEQKSMLDSLGNFVGDLLEDLFKTVKTKEISMDILEETSIDIDNVINKALSAGIAQYLGMFISEKGAFPIKLNNVRLVIVELADKYMYKIKNLSKLMLIFRPLRIIPTVMGLAAIVAGLGMDETVNKYVPKVLGGSIISWAITEPDAGTNTHKITTTALLEGDHYRLNGQKVFITDAKDSEYMVVVAKVVSDGEYMGIRNILVDPNSKGVSMTPMDIALTGDTQYNVYFDDVIVPKENLLAKGIVSKREAKEISGGTFSTLNLERIFVATFALALGRIIINKSIEYAKKRGLFENPTRVYQCLKHSLSRVKIKLESANLIAQRAAEAYDTGEDLGLVGVYANMAKLTASEAVNEACEIAMDIHGSYGFLMESDLVTLMPAARVLSVAPINNEMVLNYLGEHLLGLPKSYR